MLKNIAFDLHGTLDASRDLQLVILENFKSKQFIPYILSGATETEVSGKINAIFAKYENMFAGTKDAKLFKQYINDIKILSIVDTCQEFNIPMKYVDQGRNTFRWWCDDNLWWPMKSIICNIHKIHILIDDKKEYAKYFGLFHTCKFVLFDEKTTDVGLLKVLF